MKPNKPHAVGIVIKNRWQLTVNTLNSIFYSDQDKNSFDLFLIDNGSSPANQKNLKDYVNSNLLSIKNVFFLESEITVPKAWNLFLSLTQDYEYRTKMDNDIILSRTIVPTKKALVQTDTGQRMIEESPTPMIVDAAAGAPRGAGPVLGGGKRRSPTAKITVPRSCFLDHMQTFMKENDAEIVALVPVNPEVDFMSMWSEVIKAKWKGSPYLFGACMMISKKCFDEIGYFDERIFRQIDIEYSQRAMKQGMNVGYHDWYFCKHMGASKSTEDPQIIQQKYQETFRIYQEQGMIEKYGSSGWLNILPALKEQAANTIVTIKK